jgi:uncharacterized lipoprotein YbaY
MQLQATSVVKLFKRKIIMKTKFIASTLIALAAVASSSAFASTSYGTTFEADSVVNTPSLSKLGRAEVRNDTALWNKTNYSVNLESVAVADVDAVPAAVFASKVSRDDVKTETALWNKTHYSENLESVAVTESN